MVPRTRLRVVMNLADGPHIDKDKRMAKHSFEREEYDLKFDGALTLESSNHLGARHARWIGMANLGRDRHSDFSGDRRGRKGDESGRRRISSRESDTATGKV